MGYETRGANQTGLITGAESDYEMASRNYLSGYTSSGATKTFGYDVDSRSVLRIEAAQTAGYAYVRKAITTVVGKKYRISFDYKIIFL